MGLTLEYLFREDSTALKEVTEGIFFHDLWETCRPDNREECRKLALVFLILRNGDPLAQDFLRKAAKAGLLEKKDVFWLFHASKRIGLEWLSALSRGEEALVSTEELFTLARTIHQGDCRFESMIRHLVDTHLRDPSFVIPKDLLQTWFGQLGVFADGKTKSLLMIVLYLTDPESLTPQMVCEEINQLVCQDPNSHGIGRMFAILITMIDEGPYTRRPWQRLVSEIDKTVDVLLEHGNTRDVPLWMISILESSRIPRQVKHRIVKKIEVTIDAHVVRTTAELQKLKQSMRKPLPRYRLE